MFDNKIGILDPNGDNINPLNKKPYSDNYKNYSKEELDALRESQMQQGLKPRYDGRWRPEEGKTLPAIPAGVDPVVRFKNPKTGLVEWNDLVKGHIAISNEELDES